MKYIRQTPNESGSFPALQDKPAPGLLAFPEEFVAVFYPAAKECAGCVAIEHDGKTVTACEWNEEAYQAYIASLPEPVEPEPSTEEVLLELAADHEARICMMELGV